MREAIEEERNRTGKEPRVQVALGRYAGKHKILNISSLARETGIPRHIVETFVKGTVRQIRLEDLARLCCYFGCSPGDLLILEDCCD